MSTACLLKSIMTTHFPITSRRRLRVSLTDWTLTTDSVSGASMKFASSAGSRTTSVKTARLSLTRPWRNTSRGWTTKLRSRTVRSVVWLWRKRRADATIWSVPSVNINFAGSVDRSTQSIILIEAMFLGVKGFKSRLRTLGWKWLDSRYFIFLWFHSRYCSIRCTFCSRLT